MKSLINPFQTINPYSGVSSRFGHVKTQDLIEQIECHGFIESGRSIGRINKPQFDGFQRHMVAFNAEWLRSEEGVPQLFLFNDHRGRMSLRFYAGFFRMVCENQLTFAENNSSRINLIHTDSVHLELNNILPSLRDWMQSSLQAMNDFKGIEVSRECQDNFALKVIEKRLEKVDYSSFNTNEVLLAHRRQDVGSDAWRVYNRVQENILLGRFTVEKEKTSKKTGEKYFINQKLSKVQGIEARRELNQFIFETAKKEMLLV